MLNYLPPYGHQIFGEVSHLYVVDLPPLDQIVKFILKPNLRQIFVLFVCLMVFNATFNNTSAISWRSVLLVEETGVPGENHRPVESH